MTLTTGSDLPTDPALGFLDGRALGHVIAGVVEPAGTDLLGRESSTLSLEDFSRTKHVMFAAPQP